jgi:hypothetical protein
MMVPGVMKNLVWPLTAILGPGIIIMTTTTLIPKIFKIQLLPVQMLPILYLKMNGIKALKMCLEILLAPEILKNRMLTGIIKLIIRNGNRPFTIPNG